MITDEEFKEARKATGLSQTDAGKILGISQTSVSKIERGDVESINIGWYRLLQVYPSLPAKTKKDWLSTYKTTTNGVNDYEQRN